MLKMAVTYNALKEIINNFLLVLERENIRSLHDIKKALNKKLDVKDGPLDKYIAISSRKSNINTKPYIISYHRTSPTTPLEILIDKKLGKSLILVKAGYKLRNYLSLDTDYYGNFVQGRGIESIDFPVILSELRQLTKN